MYQRLAELGDFVPADHDSCPDDAVDKTAGPGGQKKRAPVAGTEETHPTKIGRASCRERV